MGDESSAYVGAERAERRGPFAHDCRPTPE
jgi:hypothetical protein